MDYSNINILVVILYYSFCMLLPLGETLDLSALILATACESIIISNFFKNKKQTKKLLYELHMQNHVNCFMGILSLGGHFDSLVFHLTSEHMSDSIRPEKLRFRVLMEEPALERRDAIISEAEER